MKVMYGYILGRRSLTVDRCGHGSRSRRYSGTWFDQVPTVSVEVTEHGDGAVRFGARLLAERAVGSAKTPSCHTRASVSTVRPAQRRRRFEHHDRVHVPLLAGHVQRAPSPSLTFDFDDEQEFHSGHYASLVDDSVFDTVLDRLTADP